MKIINFLITSIGIVFVQMDNKLSKLLINEKKKSVSFTLKNFFSFCGLSSVLIVFVTVLSKGVERREGRMEEGKKGRLKFLKIL